MIANREKSCSVISDEREENHHSKTHKLYELSYSSPSQGKHTGAYDDGDYVNTRSPHSPCFHKCWGKTSSTWRTQVLSKQIMKLKNWRNYWFIWSSLLSYVNGEFKSLTVCGSAILNHLGYETRGKPSKVCELENGRVCFCTEWLIQMKGYKEGSLWIWGTEIEGDRVIRHTSQ